MTTPLSMKCIVSSLLILSGFSSALESNVPESPQSLTETICKDRPRERCLVELDVPENCVPIEGGGAEDPACPIVFFLHGSGGSIAWFSKTSGVHNHSFIGIYPQGELGWNTGPKDSNDCEWADFNCLDDPNEGDFIAAIIAEVRSQGAHGNVYAIGNSNGAALAHRLAANAGNDLPIKGIVTKVTQLLSTPERSGPGPLNYNQPQSGSPAVSVLQIMGSEDGLIPYFGGKSPVFGDFQNDFQFMSAIDSIETWADHNGCNKSLKTTDETYTTDKGTHATKDDYSNGCPDNVIVEHYTIWGGDHGAGGNKINDDKIDYVVAFDFINRVENGSSSGTEPSVAPIATPTTVEDPPCANDPNWHGKFSADHGCDYIAQSPANRCGFESDDGTLASEACPVACDGCSSEGEEPTVSPIATPTTVEDPCANDPNWHGKFSADHGCDYIAQSPANRCSFESDDGTPATVGCPGICVDSCKPTRNLRGKQIIV